MSACREFISQLGALADGELSARDRAAVDGHLRGCPGCQERTALLAAQGAALRERLSARAAPVDFSRLTDRVMARVAKEVRPSAAERMSIWSGEMWGAHRSLFAAAGSLAVAACVALAVLLQPLDAGSGTDERLQAEALADAAQPQVDEVDFGTHDGAVMRLSDKTPVIWLGEDHAQ